jgi:hypothetical protein
MPTFSLFPTNRRALSTPRYPKNKREEKLKIMTTKTCPVSVDKCNNRGQYHRNIKFIAKRKSKFYSIHDVIYRHPQAIPVKSNTLITGTNIISSSCTNKPDKLPYNDNVHTLVSGYNRQTDRQTDIHTHRQINQPNFLYGNSIESSLHFIHTESTSNFIAIFSALFILNQPQIVLQLSSVTRHVSQQHNDI